LNDINHPIWDDCRDLFLNEQHFRNHIKRLTSEDVVILFNNYWSMAIDEKIREIELESNNKRQNWWWSLLDNVTKKEVEKKPQLDSNDLFIFFTENLEKNKEWKKQWHNDFYYLNKPFKKDSYWKSVEQMNKIYAENRSWNDAGYVVEETGRIKNKKKKKLWNSLDWWKRT
jgi:hypothetical protein